MKSLDLSGLSPARVAHFTEALAGAELTIAGGVLAVAKHTELSAALIGPAELRDIERAACRGLEDGTYLVGVGDVVRPVPEVNPFAASTYNLTQIMQMRRNSPELAARCEKAAAGR